MIRIPVVSRVATGVVAVIAGLASYIHIFRVARHAGEQALVAGLLPFASDGLIVVGSLAMLEDKLDGRAPRWSARLAVVFGVTATLAANVASAQHSVTSRLVAAAPPAAFLLAVEVVTRRGRRISEPVEEPAKLMSELPVEPGEPADEPSEPVREPRGPLPGVLTTAARVRAAHVAEPDAT